VAESFTSYTVDNDRRFRESLKKAAEVSTDFRIPFGLILSDFYKSQQSIFGLKGPGKYPAISEKYGDRKQKLVGFRYPLLVRTGALAASLLGPNNKGSISKITNLSLIFGTSIAYGIYHQSDAGRSKIPLRKFLFIGPEAPRFATSETSGRLERWLGIVSDHIDREIKKAGLANV
jgi:hypothetical protein